MESPIEMETSVLNESNQDLFTSEDLNDILVDAAFSEEFEQDQPKPAIFDTWEAFPVAPNAHHTVLFQLPLTDPIKPHISSRDHCWHEDYVRMPFSPKNLYPVKVNDQTELRQRWTIVQQSLSQTIRNSFELERAILSYNTVYANKWKFNVLHEFFAQVPDDDSQRFFNVILPKMCELALALPELLPCSVPLLKKTVPHAISLSQKQLGSLMANAFFCTFPRRNTSKANSEYAMYPYINFARLFLHRADETVKFEKLKCLFNYFHRICDKDPVGVVTFKRNVQNRPFSWTQCTTELRSVNVRFDSTGMIENEGAGMLQVDFANKYVGGGVLDFGCVQEEIRFMLCPELIITRLFTEELQPNEALVIVGVEQYNTATGYGGEFKWSGNFNDTTPRDQYARIKCNLVAMDALYFARSNDQYTIGNINRELNKAYVGFRANVTAASSLPAVASGNWGCGAFRGSPFIKFLIQLAACAAQKRDLCYFTFGDRRLMNTLEEMYVFLTDNCVTVGELHSILTTYGHHRYHLGNSCSLYDFIFNKIRPSPSTPVRPTANMNSSDTESQDIIESTPPELLQTTFKMKKTSAQSHVVEVNAIVSETDDDVVPAIDDDVRGTDEDPSPKDVKNVKNKSLLLERLEEHELAQSRVVDVNCQSDVTSSPCAHDVNPPKVKRKMTDYFNVFNQT